MEESRTDQNRTEDRRRKEKRWELGQAIRSIIYSTCLVFVVKSLWNRRRPRYYPSFTGWKQWHIVLLRLPHGDMKCLKAGRPLHPVERRRRRFALGLATLPTLVLTRTLVFFSTCTTVARTLHPALLTRSSLPLHRRSLPLDTMIVLVKAFWCFDWLEWLMTLNTRLG